MPLGLQGHSGLRDRWYCAFFCQAFTCGEHSPAGRDGNARTQAKSQKARSRTGNHFWKGHDTWLVSQRCKLGLLRYRQERGASALSPSHK